MNALPAKTQDSERGGPLTLVKGPGRPTKEEAEQRAAEAEARRAETRAYLEQVGLFQEAQDMRSKAFDRWSVKECDAALKWAAKQLAKNGVEAPPVEEVAPAVATPPMPEEPVRVESVRAYGRVVVDTLADPRSWPTPYVHEVIAWTKVFELEGEVRSLTDELSDAFSDLKRFQDIRRLSEAPGYGADLDHIYIVMGIDNGRAVRDIAHAIQGILFDAKRRNVSGYKGEATAKIVITFDKDRLPSDCDVAIITCETAQKVPAAICGSRIGMDGTGKVVAPREFFLGLPLGQAAEGA